MNHPEQQHLQRQPGLRRPFQFLFPLEQHAQQVVEVNPGGPARQPRQGVPLRVGHRGQMPGLGMEPRHQEVPGVEDQVLVKTAQVLALVIERLDEIEDLRPVAVDDGGEGPQQRPPVGHPQDAGDLRGGDAVAPKGHHLVQKSLRVPEAALRGPGHQAQPLGVDPPALLLGQLRQVRLDQPGGNPPEIVALAPGQDGHRHLVGMGGGQDEDCVGRRLLQSLEEGVEGRVGEHVDFVDDIDLVRPLGGHVLDLLPQVPDFVDAPVGGAVDFQHVQGGAVGDLPADLAGVVGVGRGALLAVEGLGQDAGHRGLADAPGAAEQKSVGHPAGAQGVLQRPGDGLLAHHLLKVLGTPFPGQNLISHGG